MESEIGQKAVNKFMAGRLGDPDSIVHPVIDSWGRMSASDRRRWVIEQFGHPLREGAPADSVIQQAEKIVTYINSGVPQKAP